MIFLSKSVCLWVFNKNQQNYIVHVNPKQHAKEMHLQFKFQTFPSKIL